MKLEGTGAEPVSVMAFYAASEWKGADFSYPTGLDDPQPGEWRNQGSSVYRFSASDEAAAALAGADSEISPRLFQCFLRNLCPGSPRRARFRRGGKELYAAGFSTPQPPDLICLSSVPGTEHRQPPSERMP